MFAIGLWAWSVGSIGMLCKPVIRQLCTLTVGLAVPEFCYLVVAG